MSQPCDLNRSRTALEQDCTLIAVIEMSLNSWVIAGIVPGIERHPLKKLAVDEDDLLKLLRRWQTEAVKAGHTVKRVVVAFEAAQRSIVTACKLAESLNDSLHRRLRRSRHLLRRYNCYRRERPLPGGTISH